MLWIDQKYINMLGIRLRNFKRKSQYLWNFSCPLCGDSSTRSTAARGFVYRKGDQLNYRCHKCGVGMSAKNFIAAVAPDLHKEMQLEYFKPAEDIEPVFAQEPPVFDKSINPFKGLIKISELSKDHFCYRYVDDRYIPRHVWDDLYFTPTFYAWAGYLLPGRYKVPKDARDDEPRLVIPMRNAKGEVTGFQGRALKGEEPKYITLALTKDEPLIYGLDNIDPKQKIYVLEGPIDAMFLPNAIACCGGDITSELLRLELPQTNFIVIYDNEPRNRHTIKKIEKAIKSGFSVCIWPDLVEKDVNEIVKKNIKFGLSSACKYVFTKINEGTYTGAAAFMALTRWNRIGK